MIRVSFFTQNRWAFGNIHHSLSKVLYKYGIISEVIDFTVSYQLKEFQYLNDCTDLFITNPDAVPPLRSYKIPYEKIAIVAHAEWDILRALNIGGEEIFNNCIDYAVVSKHLFEKSKEFGIKRIPKILPVGVFSEKFNYPLPVELKTVGYAGAFETYNWKGVEIKRGHLVSKILSICYENGIELNYNPHNFYMWQSMPGYYKDVDLIFITSLEEGAGLPYMEAAVAGRGIMTTPVGYAKEKHKVGLIFPFDENEYINNAIHYIKYFKENPKKFIEHCEMNRKFGKNDFDWEVRVDSWVKFIKEVYHVLRS
ncbi:MAG: glycosyltransferase [Patescibacteria group bacterium]|nr:glycosyltransferase [Patescibacteria group bacterium]